MAKARLLLDTDVILDYLCEREPHYADARKLMVLGYMGEFDLWVTPAQVVDMFDFLSDGCKPRLVPQTRERLRGLRTFVNVHATGDSEVDRLLAGCAKDPKAALLQEAALDLRADALIACNKGGFGSKALRVMDCAEFFAWVEKTMGISYAELGI